MLPPTSLLQLKMKLDRQSFMQRGSKNPTMSGASEGSHSGLGPPFKLALESNKFEATQLISDTIIQAGQAPPRTSQRLPEPHRSIRGSSARCRNSRAWLRHIAEMFPRSGVIPFLYITNAKSAGKMYSCIGRCKSRPLKRRRCVAAGGVKVCHFLAFPFDGRAGGFIQWIYTEGFALRAMCKA